MAYIFYRGVNVESWKAEDVVEKLLSGDLNGHLDPRSWHIRYPQPLEVAHRADLCRELTEIRPRESWVPASYACGDLEGASHYAWKKGASMADSVPIIIEFETDFSKAVVDGRDSLYSLIHFAQHEEVCLIMQMAWGKAIMPYLALAAATRPDDRQGRHALVDLACTDEDVKAAHYENRNVIAGRYGTKFRSAFMVPDSVTPESVKRVWVSQDPPIWDDVGEVISVPTVFKIYTTLG